MAHNLQYEEVFYSSYSIELENLSVTITLDGGILEKEISTSPFHDHPVFEMQAVTEGELLLTAQGDEVNAELLGFEQGLLTYQCVVSREVRTLHLGHLRTTNISRREIERLSGNQLAILTCLGGCSPRVNILQLGIGQLVCGACIERASLGERTVGTQREIVLLDLAQHAVDTLRTCVEGGHESHRSNDISNLTHCSYGFYI